MRIAIPEATDRALAELARRELRDPRRQAEVLLARALRWEGVLHDVEHRAETVESRAR